MNSSHTAAAARDGITELARHGAAQPADILTAQTLADVPAPPAFVELDDTAAAWHAALIEANTQIDHYKEIAARAAEHVQAAMGDAPEARIRGKKVVTWAWSKPRLILNRDSLEATYGPEAIAAHLRASKPSRPFKILGGN